jgi:hypothetical protein
MCPKVFISKLVKAGVAFFHPFTTTVSVVPKIT